MRRLALALLAALVAAAPLAAREVGERLGPETQLRASLDGAPETLGEMLGRPVLLVFWASWCEDCMRELPKIEGLHRRWGERAVVHGVSVDARRRDLQRFLRKNEEHLTIGVSHDPGGAAARAFLVRETPTTLLIDRDGAVRWRRVGFDERWVDELDDALRTLAKPGGGAS